MFKPIEIDPQKLMDNLDEVEREVDLMVRLADSFPNIEETHPEEVHEVKALKTLIGNLRALQYFRTRDLDDEDPFTLDCDDCGCDMDEDDESYTEYHIHVLDELDKRGLTFTTVTFNTDGYGVQFTVPSKAHHERIAANAQSIVSNYIDTMRTPPKAAIAAWASKLS